MWIRTQNGAALYHVIAVRAVKMVTERSYSVTGILAGVKEPVVLAEYETYEDALQEVRAIEAFLIAGTKKVYQIQTITKA